MTIFEIFPDIEKNPIFLRASCEIANRYLNDATMKIAEFAPGTVAYSSEAEGIRVGILLSGSARVQTGNVSSGEHALLRTLRIGDMFGIANLYAENEPFPSLIRTAEICTILFIDGTAFKSFIENDSTALRNYLAFQSKKIVYLNRKIMTFTAGTVEKKLAVFLLEHENDHIVISPCSMSELAELLNVGRASLYRGLDLLEEDGLIVRNGKTILIPDQKALLNFI